MGIEGHTWANMIVTWPSAPTLAKQHHRQPKALGEVEHAVLLVMIPAALRAGKHGVVVVHDDGP